MQWYFLAAIVIMVAWSLYSFFGTTHGSFWRLVARHPDQALSLFLVEKDCIVDRTPEDWSAYVGPFSLMDSFGRAHKIFILRDRISEIQGQIRGAIKKRKITSIEKEFSRTLKATRSLDMETQRWIARYVLDNTSVIKSARQIGGPAGTSAAQMLSKKVTEDRQAALAAGATSDTDPSWNAAALVESWAITLIGSLNGKISQDVHENIDKMLFDFVAEVSKR
jgi:hypothetical protein